LDALPGEYIGFHITDWLSGNRYNERLADIVPCNLLALGACDSRSKWSNFLAAVRASETRGRQKQNILLAIYFQKLAHFSNTVICLRAVDTLV
jgi:hypothetical protein